MRYEKAIVRTPGNRYITCLSTHPLHSTVSLEKAREQHEKYCSTLEEIGLEIVHVPRDDEHPDSCFVEDNAVVHKGKALICRMAKKSRRGEQKEVAEVLKQYTNIRWARSPATIEGGDVVHHEDGLIIGISKRTNHIGIEQIRNWLDVPVKTINAPDIMHLKSYVTYLGRGIMIATKRFASHPSLEDFNVLSPPKGDEYAADTLAVGNTVLMAAGHPRTHKIIRDAGFEVITIDVSEIEKCDGALTCLSILF